MAATVKIWWHDGSTLDHRSHPTPLINEPEIGFESPTVGVAPVAVGPVPEGACVAVIESPIGLRYRVLAPGEPGDAADPEAKPLIATGFSVATVGVVPGGTLSLSEAP